MRRSAWAGLLLFLLLPFPAAPAAAGGERGPRDARFEKIAEGLLHGIRALEALGRREEAERLEAILRELKAKHERAGREGEDRPERERAERHLEILRLGFHALEEAEKRDAMDLLEHAIHARELALEGRDDPEAREIRESAPKPGAVAELLSMASRIWKEFGEPEKAGACAELAGWYAKRARRPGGGERDAIEREIEVLKLAIPALREAEKPELVERVEHAIRARKLALEGRRDREAAEVRESAPGPGSLAETLFTAGDLWARFGHEEKAGACRELAKRLAEVDRRRAGRRERGEPERRGGEAAERIERLEDQIAELREQLDRLTDELEELGRRIR